MARRWREEFKSNLKLMILYRVQVFVLKESFHLDAIYQREYIVDLRVWKSMVVRVLRKVSVSIVCLK